MMNNCSVMKRLCKILLKYIGITKIGTFRVSAQKITYYDNKNVIQ